MNLVPLSSLFTRLVNTPSRRDTGAIADYRTLCMEVYGTAFQAAVSAGFDISILARFPAVNPAVNAIKFRAEFAAMGRSQLVMWATRFCQWVASLDDATRERLAVVEIAAP